MPNTGTSKHKSRDRGMLDHDEPFGHTVTTSVWVRG